MIKREEAKLYDEFSAVYELSTSLPPVYQQLSRLRTMSLLSLLSINIKYFHLTPSSTSQITILLHESLIEELTGCLTVNNGEILRVEKPRKKNSTEENKSAENTAATCVELQRELIRQEIETRPQNPPHIDQGHATVTHEMCLYCRCSPCVLFSETLPARLRAFGLPRMTNHTKRKGDYRAFYTILNCRGLWRDPIYIARKEALRCYVEDVREVMPICVVEDVRKRWPNPDGVPYCGHPHSLNQHYIDPRAFPSIPVTLMKRKVTR
ncbi:uncharacterized protein [Montipora capricornis]|uniref:uncharacterized protein n=1 Tax=Montipora capricornis TaxID=246305 RepID=UPI0035F21822